MTAPAPLTREEQLDALGRLLALARESGAVEAEIDVTRAGTARVRVSWGQPAAPRKELRVR